MSQGSDERVAQQRGERRARRMGVALIAFFVMVAVVGLLLAALLRTDPEPGKGCSDDARMGPNGQIYGRDPDRRCHFIDENGNDLGG